MHGCCANLSGCGPGHFLDLLLTTLLNSCSFDTFCATAEEDRKSELFKAHSLPLVDWDKKKKNWNQTPHAAKKCISSILAGYGT